MTQSAIHRDPRNTGQITCVPAFAIEVSQAIARGECHVIPCFAEIQFAVWHSVDLCNAFNSAREQIYAVTRAGQRAFNTLAGQDIWRKWCLASQFQSFQGMQNWPPAVLKIVVFDIWRDLMWVKHDGLDDVIIGVASSAYGKHQYAFYGHYDAAAQLGIPA